MLLSSLPTSKLPPKFYIALVAPTNLKSMPPTSATPSTKDSVADQIKLALCKPRRGSELGLIGVGVSEVQTGESNKKDWRR